MLDRNKLRVEIARISQRGRVKREELINHKGTWCWVKKDLFCQEGNCSECEVFCKYSQDKKGVTNK